MSVTITLTDAERTELLIIASTALEAAKVYELYAPKAAKPYWAERVAAAARLLELAINTARDPDLCLAARERVGSPSRWVCSLKRGHGGNHIDGPQGVVFPRIRASW